MRNSFPQCYLFVLVVEMMFVVINSFLIEN